MPREGRALTEAETLQPQDAAGHLLFTFAEAGIVFCWRCGAYSKDRTHSLRGECRGEPGPGQGYMLGRLKNSQHPVSGNHLGGRPKRLLL